MYRYLDVIVYKLSFISKAVEGIYLAKVRKLKLSLENILFQCTKGGYLLIDYVCDLSVDCPNDKSDEQNCTYQNMFKNNYCKEIEVQKLRKQCSHLYYTSLSGSCHKYSNMADFLNPLWKTKKVKEHQGTYKNMWQGNKSIKAKTFKCDNGKILDSLLLNDLIADCGQDAEDEPELKSLLTNNIYYPCGKLDMIPCTKGHSHCFIIADICVYKLSRLNNIIPCRNGKHLPNCKKFECNMTFKCIKSYCVLWTYVCDGKWDCPEGDDEELTGICGQELICNKMYRCKETKNMCIHLANVCDGFDHCPFSDDEMFCNLQNIYCPSVCSCLLYAIECKRLNRQNSIFHNFNGSTYFSIYIHAGSLLSAKVINRFRNAVQVQNENNIKDICTITDLEKCLVFDVGNNLISSIGVKCFAHFSQLNVLVLSGNLIIFIKKHSFLNLHHLKFLEISSHPLRIFSNFALENMYNSKVLKFLNLSLECLDKKLFDDVNMKIIITKDYHVCCIAPESTFCSAHELFILV